MKLDLDRQRHRIASRRDQESAHIMTGSEHKSDVDGCDEASSSIDDYRQLSLAAGGFGGREERRRAW